MWSQVSLFHNVVWCLNSKNSGARSPDFHYQTKYLLRFSASLGRDHSNIVLFSYFSILKEMISVPLPAGEWAWGIELEEEGTLLGCLKFQTSDFRTIKSRKTYFDQSNNRLDIRKILTLQNI